MFKIHEVNFNIIFFNKKILLYLRIANRESQIKNCKYEET